MSELAESLDLWGLRLGRGGALCGPHRGEALAARRALGFRVMERWHLGPCVHPRVSVEVPVGF